MPHSAAIDVSRRIRERSSSKYEESIVSQFIESCVDFKTSLTFHTRPDCMASDSFELSSNLLLLGCADGKPCQKRKHFSSRQPAALYKRVTQ